MEKITTPQDFDRRYGLEGKWPVRVYRKTRLALAYAESDDPKTALQELWYMLACSAVEGRNAKLLVKEAAANPRGAYFNPQQVDLIFRALGRP